MIHYFLPAFRLSPHDLPAVPSPTAGDCSYHGGTILARCTLLLFCLFSLICPPSFAVAAEKHPDALGKLVGRFDGLLKDEKLGMRRDLWISLEEQFAALEKSSKGDSAARASFYNARSREELAKRSFLTADHREAVARFGSVADKYGRFAVAPAALYRQGFILLNMLKTPSAAVVSLQRLIKSYPKARGIEDAKVLLAEAQKAAAAPKTSIAKPQVSPKGSPSAKLQSIRWKKHGQKAIITLELDSATNYDVDFVSPDKAGKTPGRLHLNIADAVAASSIKPGLKPQNLVVSRISTSQSADGIRISLDCDEIRCYAVTSPPKTPQIIQIEVSRKDDIKGGISVASGASGSKSGNKSAGKGKKDVLEQLGLTVKTIMLDAGHGGKDPGAIANNFEEKRFTLDMAKRIGALLQKEGYKVLYTRADNRYISLQDRPDMANSKKADLFISIHVNANPNSAVRGLETYYLDEAKNQDAATVAARENSVSVKNISDLQFILTDLMLSSKLAESRHLAQCVHKSILGTLRTARLAAVDNGVRSAPFYVLMGARMPAILLEFGYITNDEDAANLRSEKYLQQQAEGVVKGIRQYKQELAQITRKK
jgi:N-acetylmuramoyl-L-alanine amidase